MIKSLGRKYLEIEKQIYLENCISRKTTSDVSAKNACRFLCIQMNAIGDAIMTQPAWRALKSAKPDARIDLICRPHIKALFETDPAIQSIITADPRKYRSWRFVNHRRIKQTIGQGDYDAIIDFTGLPLTAGLCAGASASLSVGFKRVIKHGMGNIDLGRCYDLTARYSESKAIREMLFQLVLPWVGNNAPIPKPVVEPDQKAMREAHELLEKQGMAGHDYIVMHPGGKWPPKLWPYSHWKILAGTLSRDLNCKIMFLGGQADRDALAEITVGIDNSDCVKVASSDIGVSCALIANARLCISNDSAAMHIAAASGTDSIALFGPVAPRRSAPSEAEGCRVLYDGMFCSPCMLYYSKNRCRRGINFCMHAISPVEVAEKAKQILF